MKPGRLRAVRWEEMSIVFQGALHTLNPVRRIGWQIEEAIELHRPTMSKAESRKRVAELLDVVGIPDGRAADYPHQLSGGQKQRVLIALALACDPRLLIADEPTTALDVMVQAQVLRLLEDLQRDLGLAMLFITHDLSTLAGVCQRLAVMYAGRIVEEGTEQRRVRAAGTPVHDGARGGVPRDRRHALPHGAVRARRRPARPRVTCRPAARSIRAARGRWRTARRGIRSRSPSRPVARRRAFTWRSAGDRRRRCRRRARHGLASARGAWPRGRLPEPQGWRRASRRRRRPRTCARGRCWRSSASQAAARRPSPARSWASSDPTAGEVWFRGEPLRYDGRSLKALSARRADGLPGPVRGAQPAPDDLRGGRRGPPYPRSLGRARRPPSLRRSPSPACARPSASSRSTRTRSRAASGNASSSRERWRSTPG